MNFLTQKFFWTKDHNLTISYRLFSKLNKAFFFIVTWSNCCDLTKETSFSIRISWLLKFFNLKRKKSYFLFNLVDGNIMNFTHPTDFLDNEKNSTFSLARSYLCQWLCISSSLACFTFRCFFSENFSGLINYFEDFSKYSAIQTLQIKIYQIRFLPNSRFVESLFVKLKNYLYYQIHDFSNSSRFKCFFIANLTQPFGPYPVGLIIWAFNFRAQKVGQFKPFKFITNFG